MRKLEIGCLLLLRTMIRQLIVGTLFIQLHGKLKQFSFSIVRSEEEAEDIIAELFILIIQRKEQLCQLDAPMYYFYATVRNM